MQDFTSARLLKVLPPLSAAVILLLTLWFHLRPGSVKPGITRSLLPGSAAISAKPAETVDFRQIAGWSLFGEAAYAPTLSAPEPAESLEDLPPASIDLKVSGIAYSLDGARGHAIVGTPDGQQHQYRVGDELMPGVTVHAIRPLEVVISNQGKLESVALPLESIGRAGTVPASSYPNPMIPQIPAPPGVTELPIQDAAQMPGNH